MIKLSINSVLSGDIGDWELVPNLLKEKVHLLLLKSHNDMFGQSQRLQKEGFSTLADRINRGSEAYWFALKILSDDTDKRSLACWKDVCTEHQELVLSTLYDGYGSLEVELAEMMSLRAPLLWEEKHALQKASLSAIQKLRQLKSSED